MAATLAVLQARTQSVYSSPVPERTSAIRTGAADKPALEAATGRPGDVEAVLLEGEDDDDDDDEEEEEEVEVEAKAEEEGARFF